MSNATNGSNKIRFEKLSLDWSLVTLSETVLLNSWFKRKWEERN